ncbi:acyl-CoA dehydrogenase family protein [Rhodococcus wratislaviensis]|nr:acyl-CoA dehydrogenase family protein [Rhodococcus wratislaviensis]
MYRHDAASEIDNTFSLTDDEREIVYLAKEFADEYLAPALNDPDFGGNGYAGVIAEAAELGLGGISTRADTGGADVRNVVSVRIFEQLATGDPWIASYLAIHNLATWMIDTFGSHDQRHQWVPRLCSMEVIGSYCLTEPSLEAEATALSTSAVPDSDGYIINGVKDCVLDACCESTVYVVMARASVADPHSVSAFIVPHDAPGISLVVDQETMGQTRSLGRLYLRNVHVPAANILGGDGDGLRIATDGLDRARLNVGACSLGGAQAAFVKAASSLPQFNDVFPALLDSHEVQLRLADMHTDLEAARTLLLRAASSLDENALERLEICAMAKRFATETGVDIATNVVELFDRYGIVSQHGVAKIAADLRIHRTLEGTDDRTRTVIANSIAAEAAAQ